jgi:hypothetical protein
VSNLQYASKVSHDKPKLQELLNEVIIQKMKMDKFFSMFLEKFENDMDPNVLDTPIWNLYNTKLTQYRELRQLELATQYYLARPL